MAFQFEKKLSLDGVAIIVGVVAALVWIGELKATINELQKQGAEHSQQLNDLGKSVDGVKSDVAVLSAVVSERTGKPSK